MQLLVEEGPQAVTLDAVSQRAKVSKGGLQHHFPSKQDLLDTLFDCLFQDFEGQLHDAVEAEPDTPGRHARAYIRLVFDMPNDAPSQRALLLLGLNSPVYAARWRATCEAALLADGSDRTSANRRLLCRLAVDGLWCAQIFDSYRLDEARQTDLRNLLLDFCHQDAS